MTVDALHAGKAAFHAHLAAHECCRSRGTICPTCREALRGKRGGLVVAARAVKDLGFRLAALALVVSFVFDDLPQAVDFAQGAALASCVAAFVAWRAARKW